MSIEDLDKMVRQASIIDRHDASATNNIDTSFWDFYTKAREWMKLKKLDRPTNKDKEDQTAVRKQKKRDRKANVDATNLLAKEIEV